MSVPVIIESIFIIIVLVGCLIGNGCIVAAIVKNRQLQERPGTYIVASLALVDGLFNPIFMTFELVREITIETKYCEQFGTYFTILLYVSILHLLLLSVDRYIAVFFPLRYENVLSKKRCFCLLAIVWFGPTFSMTIIPAIFSKQYSLNFRGGLICSDGSTELSEASTVHTIHIIVNSTLMAVLPFIGMLVINVRIAMISYKQAKRVVPVGGLSEREKRNKENLMKEMKWAKTIGIVIGAFAVTYIPSVALVSLRAKLGPGTFSVFAIKMYRFVIFLNSALNAPVYSLRSNDYRQGIKRFFSDVKRTIFPHSVRTEITSLNSNGQQSSHLTGATQS